MFKTLFTKEPIHQEDFFLTKEVKNASIFLDDKFIGRLATVYASDTGREMFRVNEDKKGSISGTKGHKWKLAKEWAGKEDVDMAYYREMVKKAVTSIRKVGDINVLLPDYQIVEEEDMTPKEVLTLDDVSEVTEDLLPF